jgi:hypothetical protein
MLCQKIEGEKTNKKMLSRNALVLGGINGITVLSTLDRMDRK